MILFILIILIFLGIFLFFNKKKVTFNESKNVIIEIDKLEFIESDTFQGKKEGSIFKNCKKGLGYYLDN